jgi:DNA polymerase elongation subunit (family B)
MMASDPGYIPRYRERIPYIIVDGQEAMTKKKMSQKDLALSPQEFVDSALSINSEYYIRKMINPALNRIFDAIFEINVDVWYDLMPKAKRNRSYIPRAGLAPRTGQLIASKSLAFAQN